jgi:hypothetical protein
MPELNESKTRRRARQLGYRLQKVRTRKWEGDSMSPAYRLIDLETGLPAWRGFDSVDAVEAWLDS